MCLAWFETGNHKLLSSKLRLNLRNRPGRCLLRLCFRYIKCWKCTHIMASTWLEGVLSDPRQELKPLNSSLIPSWTVSKARTQQFCNRPISKIPQCTCDISQSIPQWSRNVFISFPKRCIVGYGTYMHFVDLWDWFMLSRMYHCVGAWVCNSIASPGGNPYGGNQGDEEALVSMATQCCGPLALAAHLRIFVFRAKTNSQPIDFT